MAVKRFSTSLISDSGQDKSSNFIANYSPAIDEMELIERVRVGSGGTSAIEFTNIPATYQHLQVRGIGRHVRTVTLDEANISVRINGDTTSGNYYGYHYLEGSGSAASAGAISSGAYVYLGMVLTGSNATSTFGATVFDILDYASTSKYKTFRSFAGNDRNGSGTVRVSSSLWMSTSAITSLTMTVGAGAYNFAEYSSFALYGVKAP